MSYDDLDPNPFLENTSTSTSNITTSHVDIKIPKKAVPIGDSFDTILTKLPRVSGFVQDSKDSSFLPPMMRAFLHLVWAASIAKDSKSTKKAELITEELQEASSHFKEVLITEALSDKSRGHIVTLGAALSRAVEEVDLWDTNAIEKNVTILGASIFTLASALDRELLGLTKSSPGNGF